MIARIFLFDQFITPTESMMPTLLPGDRIIVDKTIAGARIYKDIDFDPSGGTLRSFRTRGRRSVLPNDIVVFNFPNHDGKINFVINNVYAKRCIGTPGDTISIKAGVFFNNNHEGPIGLIDRHSELASTPDSIIPDFVMHTMPHDTCLKWTIKDMGPLYLPRKGDMIMLTALEGCLYRMALEWEIGSEITYDWDRNVTLADGRPLDHHIFEHGYYFLCGDNVINSNDSRYWGLVPEDYIIGVVSMISYSIEGKTGRLRTDRLMKRL